MSHKLISTLSGIEYPLASLQENADNGESLEVAVTDVERARIRPGDHLWQRFADFLPFTQLPPDCSLGEGNTPLLPAAGRLREFTRIENLLLKDETRNPTWSFKDRGTLTTIFMAREMGETLTATISTGNMGHSVAAYAAHAGMRALVFVPHYAPAQKIQPIAMHGATVLRVHATDYAAMKSKILQLAGELGVRIVSGNGPVRVEGYKLTAFELFEQMRGQVPDYIAVPTSACGHIRGLFKGYRELQAAGFIQTLPKMIIVQAANNSPLVTALRQGAGRPVPFRNFHTVAEAITSGEPAGGDEIIARAKEHSWLAESVTEEEILESQREFARAGHFVEPSSATSLYAVRKLKRDGRIEPDATVVMMLTGSGLKDMDVMPYHRLDVQDIRLEQVRTALTKYVPHPA